MTDVISLVCAACGGPLDAVAQIPAVVECGYCGAVMSVASRDVQTVTRPATPSDQLELRQQRRAAARSSFIDELAKLLAAGSHPYVAVRDAWALHLSFETTAEPIARLTVALATDFEREQGVGTVNANALGRIAEAYFKAVGELRSMTETEMNLPFLVADDSGPKHFLRKVTPQLFAELARRDPYAPPPVTQTETHADTAAEPGLSPDPPPDQPKKRKKLFGLF